MLPWLGDVGTAWHYLLELMAEAGIYFKCGGTEALCTAVEIEAMKISSQ